MLNAATAEGRATKIKRQSEFVVIARRLSKNSSAMIGFVVAVFLVLIAIFAPLIAPYPYAKQDLAHTRQAPSVQHIMGTDELGRDVFSRIVWGSRFSLTIGVLAVLVGTAIGMLFGAIAGYFGGVADDIVMRLMWFNPFPASCSLSLSRWYWARAFLTRC